MREGRGARPRGPAPCRFRRVERALHALVLLFPAASALLTLVVNRLPCLELETFEDGRWPAAGWVAVAETGGTVQASSARGGSGGLADAPWHYRPDVTLAVGSRLAAWVRADRAAEGRFYLGFDASAGGCKSLVVAFNTGELRFHSNPSYGYDELATTPVSLTPGRWYRVEVEVREGGLALGRLYDEDGTTLLAAVQQTFDGMTFQGIALRSFGGISADTLVLCP